MLLVLVLVLGRGMCLGLCLARGRMGQWEMKMPCIERFVRAPPIPLGWWLRCSAVEGRWRISRGW